MFNFFRFLFDICSSRGLYMFFYKLTSFVSLKINYRHLTYQVEDEPPGLTILEQLTIEVLETLEDR